MPGGAKMRDLMWGEPGNHQKYSCARRLDRLSPRAFQRILLLWRVHHFLFPLYILGKVGSSHDTPLAHPALSLTYRHDAHYDFALIVKGCT